MRKQFSILESALNPRRLPVMIQKLNRRLSWKKPGLSHEAYKEWLKEHAVSVEPWCQKKDTALWAETQTFQKELINAYEDKKHDLPPEIHVGNACFRLLYFLTRYYKPCAIVETGVALGFSSQTFLRALDQNGQYGKLYSSDFPYFRVPNAEQYIGMMVEDPYRESWTLHIDGDDKNLKSIVNQIEQIDLFHYDSDKSYVGRMKGFEAVRDKLAPDALILFDDLRDNPHFYDFIAQNSFKSWMIFENRGDYVGLTTNRSIQ